MKTLLYKSTLTAAIILSLIQTKSYAQKDQLKHALDEANKQLSEASVVIADAVAKVQMEIPEISAMVSKSIEAATQNVIGLPEESSLYLCDKNKIHFDIEKNKKISKVFQVTNADKLSIKNKFGKVHINTWDKNEMKVDIDILVKASTEERTQKIIDDIDIKITEEKENHLISFKTQLKDEMIKNNAEIEINYTVYMPKNNPLKLKNSFGDTYIADFDGETDIEVSYGNLKAEKLTNNNNRVSISFGAAHILYLKQSDLAVSYSKCVIDEADKLNGQVSFSSTIIKKLNNEVVVQTQYSPFEIKQITKDVKLINIGGRFGTIDLNFDSNSSSNFDLNLEFCDLKADKTLFQFNHTEKTNFNRTYKGSFGKSSTKGNVQIQSQYGEVRFDVND